MSYTISKKHLPLALSLLALLTSCSIITKHIAFSHYPAPTDGSLYISSIASSRLDSRKAESSYRLKVHLGGFLSQKSTWQVTVEPVNALGVRGKLLSSGYKQWLPSQPLLFTLPMQDKSGQATIKADVTLWIGQRIVQRERVDLRRHLFSTSPKKSHLHAHHISHWSSEPL